MAAIPSLTQAFSALGSALKVPAASSFGMPTVPNLGSAPRVGVSSPATLQSSGLMSKAPAVPNMSVLPTPAPNMSTVNGPKVAPAPTMTPVQTQKTATPTVPKVDTAMAPAPTAPTTPSPTTTGSPYVQTPSGLTVNKDTGAVVDGNNSTSVTANNQPAVPQPYANYGSYGGAAPSSGGGSYNPLITTPEAEQAFKDYQASLVPDSQETDALARLDALNASAAQAYTNTENQPIPLEFITGQKAALQRSQNALAAPLTAQITRLQAKRQIAATASKAALDRLDSLTATRRELATKTIDVPFGGTSMQYDPESGTFKPIQGGAFGGVNQDSINSWVSLIKGGQAKLEDVPQQIRQNVAQGLSSSTDVSKANQDAIAQADTVISKVDDIIPAINAYNTGVGAYGAGIKGTPAYNLAAQLDTIKSNVGFAALQAMRAASPTGGALGQVSEQENRLLQSTLASLDQGQTQEQLKANLAKVKQHFENLKKVLNAPINAQVDYDSAGNVIIKGGSGSTSSSSSSSGSKYDF